MNTYNKTMSDSELLALLESDSIVNRARRQFSNWTGMIDNAQRQRHGLSPIAMRRMEFEAVMAIVQEFNKEAADALAADGEDDPDFLEVQ